MASPRAHAQDHATASPSIRLGELLHQYTLELVLIAGVSEATNDAAVQWVHVSELEDPTPFLPPRTVLLTTGARFSEQTGPEAADAYVERLIAAGTAALGIGIGLHLDRVPPHFVGACDRLGLPLFRVPYRTAFIEIVQTAARLLNAEARERDLWALQSQRAVANASLHRDGLAAALREAAHRLERWVCVVDRAGRLVEFAPEAQRDWAPLDLIRREARHLVSRGLDSGRIEPPDGGDGMQLLALGRREAVLGVLIVEDRGAPDTAERALTSLLAALATVQLEHRAGLDSAEAALRTGVAELLLAGETALAERLALGTLLRVPLEPVVVVDLDEAEAPAAFVTELRSFDAGSRGVLRAEVGGAELVIAEARHLPAIRRLLQAHAVVAGISERGPLSRLSALRDQAARARDHARTGEPGPQDYRPALHDGVLRLLAEHPEARDRATSLLDPLRQHDARHDDRIEEAVRIWLTHHGQTSAAAAELGIHRHTLRTRVDTASRLLQRDLASPDARAELWAALRLAG